MNFDLIASIAVLVCLAAYIVHKLLEAWRYSPGTPKPTQYGDLTLQTLEMYSGFDPFRPILLSVQGKVYNVSEGSEFYGRGGPYAKMAGKECARALAKMRLEDEDFSDDISDCTVKERRTLEEWLEKFAEKYPVVGKIVPAKQLTLEQLREFDGTDPQKPMYISISGVIYNVTSGSEFYGPDGIYPFAGHECARAFALFSVNVEDCTSNLEGLGRGDLDQLQEWKMKFRSKYNIIGHIIEA